MLAVWAAKISEKASVHIFHRQGVTWAGKIALKIDPSILHDLAGQVRKDIFIVCGTNGKTTTNNMLCAAIEKEGYKVICNHTGSNMLNGVVAAFVLGAGLSGNLDEAKLKEILTYANAGAALITMKKGAIRSMPEPENIKELIGK